MGRNTNGLIPIRLFRNLPFVSVQITVGNRSTSLNTVLLDTGAARTVFSADKMLDLGLVCSADDNLFIMTGIGGDEYVFSKIIDTLTVGTFSLQGFEIQIGDMDYRLELDGIIGMDFLLATKAKVDCEDLTLRLRVGRD